MAATAASDNLIGRIASQQIARKGGPRRVRTSPGLRPVSQVVTIGAQSIGALFNAEVCVSVRATGDRGPTETELHLVREVQEVYKFQGVDINDMHMHRHQHRVGVRERLVMEVASILDRTARSRSEAVSST